MSPNHPKSWLSYYASHLIIFLLAGVFLHTCYYWLTYRSEPLNGSEHSLKLLALADDASPHTVQDELDIKAALGKRAVDINTIDDNIIHFEVKETKGLQKGLIQGSSLATFLTPFENMINSYLTLASKAKSLDDYNQILNQLFFTVSQADSTRILTFFEVDEVNRLVYLDLQFPKNNASIRLSQNLNAFHSFKDTKLFDDNGDLNFRPWLADGGQLSIHENRSIIDGFDDFVGQPTTASIEMGVTWNAKKNEVGIVGQVDINNDQGQRIFTLLIGKDDENRSISQDLLNPQFALNIDDFDSLMEDIMKKMPDPIFMAEKIPVGKQFALSYKLYLDRFQPIFSTLLNKSLLHDDLSRFGSKSLIHNVVRRLFLSFDKLFTYFDPKINGYEMPDTSSSVEPKNVSDSLLSFLANKNNIDLKSMVLSSNLRFNGIPSEHMMPTFFTNINLANDNDTLFSDDGQSYGNIARMGKAGNAHIKVSSSFVDLIKTTLKAFSKNYSDIDPQTMNQFLDDTLVGHFESKHQGLEGAYTSSVANTDDNSNLHDIMAAHRYSDFKFYSNDSYYCYKDCSDEIEKYNDINNDINNDSLYRHGLIDTPRSYRQMSTPGLRLMTSRLWNTSNKDVFDSIRNGITHLNQYHDLFSSITVTEYDFERSTDHDNKKPKYFDYTVTSLKGDFNATLYQLNRSFIEKSSNPDYDVVNRDYDVVKRDVMLPQLDLRYPKDFNEEKCTSLAHYFGFDIIKDMHLCSSDMAGFQFSTSSEKISRDNYFVNSLLAPVPGYTDQLTLGFLIDLHILGHLVKSDDFLEYAVWPGTKSIVHNQKFLKCLTEKGYHSLFDNIDQVISGKLGDKKPLFDQLSQVLKHRKEFSETQELADYAKLTENLNYKSDEKKQSIEDKLTNLGNSLIKDGPHKGKSVKVAYDEYNQLINNGIDENTFNASNSWYSDSYKDLEASVNVADKFSAVKTLQLNLGKQYSLNLQQIVAQQMAEYCPENE
ncbi:MAG: hypothetical protein ACON5A_05175 [Candidatus Comchoanobacterales bacterium]